MHLERVTDTAHPDYGQAMALYGISFPEHERREAFSQAKILSDPAYHFCLIRDGERFAGLALYWEDERSLYVEHLCILPQLRRGAWRAQADGEDRHFGNRPAGGCAFPAQKGVLPALRLCGKPLCACASALSQGERGPCARGHDLSARALPGGIPYVCQDASHPGDGGCVLENPPGWFGERKPSNGKASLRCFPPGSPKGPRGKQR